MRQGDGARGHRRARGNVGALDRRRAGQYSSRRHDDEQAP
jgi:hypothetical protein